DGAAMQEQVDRATGTSTEAGMLALQSLAAAYEGRTRTARDLNRRAVEVATQRGLKEGAAEYAAGGALWQAAYGDCGGATEAASRALVVARGRHALSWSSLALALCGQAAQARSLADEMARRF